MRVDWIFDGGRLLTMDPERPRATALAVLGGRIVAVGDGDELRRHLEAERVVSLQGRTVVPGFHDAHNHMPSFGLGLADVSLSSPSVGSTEDILRAVKARAASQPTGSWVIGSGCEGDLGSLEPGKLADFAVLSADPTAIAPERIAAIEVLATVVGGGIAHDRMGLG